MTAGDALCARLRRGAGCAVRALLGQDRTQARDVLLSCLLDADDEWRTLDWNTHGYAARRPRLLRPGGGRRRRA
jgi:hypothetical protein